MSQEYLHLDLEMLFIERTQTQLNKCLNHSDYLLLNQQLGLNLKNEDLVMAFIHSSFSHEFEVKNQELLEFYGDAVLQLIITTEIVKRYPEAEEGILSKLRSSLVNAKILGQLALNLNLDKFILVGKGEFKRKTFEAENVLADTFEALVGVLFKVHGLEYCQDKVLTWFKHFDETLFEISRLDLIDAKSKLQEFSLKEFKKLPEYKSTQLGEKFKIELWLNGKLMDQDTFHSKKIGERELAARVLENIKESSCF